MPFTVSTNWNVSMCKRFIWVENVYVAWLIAILVATATCIPLWRCHRFHTENNLQRCSKILTIKILLLLSSKYELGIEKSFRKYYIELFFLSFYRETLQRKWIDHNTMSPNTFIALKSNKIKPKHIHRWCIFSNNTIVSIYYCWLEVLEVRSIFRIFNIYWMVCILVVPITPFNVIIFIENTKSQM